MRVYFHPARNSRIPIDNKSVIVFWLRVIAGIFSPKLHWGMLLACPISQIMQIITVVWDERIKNPDKIQHIVFFLCSDITCYHLPCTVTIRHGSF